MNVVMNEPPLSLSKRITNTQSCIQDHKNSGPKRILKKAVQRPRRAWTGPCFGMGVGVYNVLPLWSPC